jgi:hypothetical protein
MTIYAQTVQVEIVANKARHEFAIGTKVKIKAIDKKGGYLCEGNDKLGKYNTWWCEESDIKAIS